MKLRAITLAAAGLLAAASAQAELQTWRFTGRLIDYVSPPPSHPGDAFDVPPEYMQFDLTFDTAVAATGNTYANPLISMKLGDEQLMVQSGTLTAGAPYSQLTAYVQSFWSEFGAELTMQVRGPWDAAAGNPRPIASVGEFLTSTDQLVDQVNQDFVQGSGLTWQQLLQSAAFKDLIPQIGLHQGAVNQQLYGLIGAHNITPGVPEPSAWALALLGGVGAAALARRRQSARQAEALAA